MGTQRYKPFGELRGPVSRLPTGHRFPGERSGETSLGPVYDFDARRQRLHFPQFTTRSAAKSYRKGMSFSTPGRKSAWSEPSGFMR